MKSNGKKHILRGHRGDTTSVCFGESFNCLYSGDRVGNVLLWDLDICRPIETLKSHHSSTVLKIQGISGGGGNTFASQGREGIIKMHDIEKKEEIWKFACKDLTFCKFSCDGESIVSLGDEIDGKNKFEVRKIRNMTDENIITFENDREEKGDVMSLFIKNNDILVGYEDGTVTEFDTRKPDEVKNQWERLHNLKPVLSVTKFKDFVFSGGASNKIIVTSSRKKKKTIKIYDLKLKGGVNDLRHDGNRVIVSAGWDHRVRMFDMMKHRPLSVLHHESQTSTSVSSVDISRTKSGEFNWNICCGFSKDKKIVFWEHFSLKRKKEKQDVK